MNERAWRLALATAALMALLAGARSAFGLFASPGHTASGVGVAAAARPHPLRAADPASLASAPVESSQWGAPAVSMVSSSRCAKASLPRKSAAQ